MKSTRTWPATSGWPRNFAAASPGRDVSLHEVGPPSPALARTWGLLKDSKLVRELAMPPYDGLIAGALRLIVPGAQVEITPWPTSGKTLAEIEQAANAVVRKMKPDLVLLPPYLRAPSLPAVSAQAAV